MVADLHSTIPIRPNAGIRCNIRSITRSRKIVRMGEATPGANAQSSSGAARTRRRGAHQSGDSSPPDSWHLRSSLMTPMTAQRSVALNALWVVRPPRW